MNLKLQDNLQALQGKDEETTLFFLLLNHTYTKQLLHHRSIDDSTSFYFLFSDYKTHTKPLIQDSLDVY